MIAPLHGFTLVTPKSSILFQSLKVSVMKLSNCPSWIWRLPPSTVTSIHFSRLTHVALPCREHQAAAAARSRLIYRFSLAWSLLLLFLVLSDCVNLFVHVVSFSRVSCQFVQSVSNVWPCKYTVILKEYWVAIQSCLFSYDIHVDFQTFFLALSLYLITLADDSPFVSVGDLITNVEKRKAVRDGLQCWGKEKV